MFANAAAGFGSPEALGAGPRPSSHQIPELAELLNNSQDPATLLEVTTQFRKLLSIGARAPFPPAAAPAPRPCSRRAHRRPAPTPPPPPPSLRRARPAH